MRQRLALARPVLSVKVVSPFGETPPPAVAGANLDRSARAGQSVSKLSTARSGRARPEACVDSLETKTPSRGGLVTAKRPKRAEERAPARLTRP